MFLAPLLSLFCACGAPPPAAPPPAAPSSTNATAQGRTAQRGSSSVVPAPSSDRNTLAARGTETASAATESKDSTGIAASSGAPQPAFPCGPFTCQRFETSEGAFAAMLATGEPRVLGIGEAHARVGTDVRSATRRFTEELLPKVAERTHSLVLELMAPNAKCHKETTSVREQQKQVTEEHASTNQNEFVTLGEQARALGVVPYLLRPSCADLDAITRAGADGVVLMLEAIARLTTTQVETLLASQPKDSSRRMVIAYGGALHNDVEPRAGREMWSYGPALAKYLEEKKGGSYGELDLIVPELILDEPVWRAQPWYGHYRAEDARGGAILMQLAPQNWVLFFPPTLPAGSTPRRAEPSTPASGTGASVVKSGAAATEAR
jgi:hypothetical protein